MFLSWRCSLGSYGRSARSAKAPYTRTFSAPVGTALFFTGEGRHRRTWLKLGCSLIAGTSESALNADNLHLRARGEQITARHPTPGSCDCIRMDDGPGVRRAAVAILVRMDEIGLSYGSSVCLCSWQEICMSCH